MIKIKKEFEKLEKQVFKLTGKLMYKLDTLEAKIEKELKKRGILGLEED